MTVDGGNQIASFVDPSTTTFDQLTLLGDGRIALTYDNTLDATGTTQTVTNVYDLRTPGQTINDSASITGSTLRNTLTVSALSYGALAVGQTVTGVPALRPIRRSPPLATAPAAPALIRSARRRLFPPSPSARVSATARTSISPAPTSPTRSPARTTSTTSIIMSAPTPRSARAERHVQRRHRQRLEHRRLRRRHARLLGRGLGGRLRRYRKRRRRAQRLADGQRERRGACLHRRRIRLPASDGSLTATGSGYDPAEHQQERDDRCRRHGWH